MGGIRHGVASALVEVECLRALDRLRLLGGVSDRAAQPLPTELGTLDAVHLAPAMVWQEGTATELVMATHDVALGLAARASSLRALGIA